MQPKPFAMGVRIEHPQAVIDRAQYGKPRGALPPADYKLAVHLPDGGAAYTFCMCPAAMWSPRPRSQAASSRTA